MEKVTVTKLIRRDEGADLQALLGSAASIYEDEDVDKSERDELLAETFSQYTEVTGRDALEDIAKIGRGHPTGSGPVHNRLAALTDNYRRGHPEQTREMHRAAGWNQLTDAERDAIRAEEAAHRDIFGKVSDMADIEKTGESALEILKTKAQLLRKAHPELTEAQAFDQVYSSPDNCELVRDERAGAIAKLQRLDAAGNPHVLTAIRVAKVDRLIERAESLMPAGGGEPMQRLNQLAKDRQQRTQESFEIAFDAIYSEPDNSELRQLEKSERLGI
ncbi:hypothetical protein SAMN05519103_04553 [Rhizobiales bacterium GAS113]|nr:hypothetical protein SAMN05519103_04553 [Rhizobiales bacterium GAS113]